MCCKTKLTGYGHLGVDNLVVGVQVLECDLLPVVPACKRRVHFVCLKSALSPPKARQHRTTSGWKALVPVTAQVTNLCSDAVTESRNHAPSSKSGS